MIGNRRSAHLQARGPSLSAPFALRIARLCQPRPVERDRLDAPPRQQFCRASSRASAELTTCSDQRKPAGFMQHFGFSRFHPGAETCGQDHNGQILSHLFFPILVPATCASALRPPGEPRYPQSARGSWRILGPSAASGRAITFTPSILESFQCHFRRAARILQHIGAAGMPRGERYSPRRHRSVSGPRAAASRRRDRRP